MLKRSEGPKTCNKGCNIWHKDFYYTQRKGKALCLKCGCKPHNKSKPKKQTLGMIIREWFG